MVAIVSGALSWKQTEGDATSSCVSVAGAMAHMKDHWSLPRHHTGSNATMFIMSESIASAIGAICSNLPTLVGHEAMLCALRVYCNWGKQVHVSM